MKPQQNRVSEQHTVVIRYWMNLGFEWVSWMNDSLNSLIKTIAVSETAPYPL